MISASLAVPFPRAAAPGRTGILQAGWLAVHAPKAARRPLVRPVREVLGAPLPAAGRILAVTARPGQESADLGGVLYAFRRAGVRLALLCLTRGEASRLNSTSQRLEEIRPWELQAAAAVIGVSAVMVADFPDGSLSRCSLTALSGRVQRAIEEHTPDLLLVIDPATGTACDVQVAKATCITARSAGLPVAARTSTHARNSWPVGQDAEASAARAVQRSAAAAHVSQSEALAEVYQQLERAGSRDRLRWLIHPAGSGKIPRPRAPRRSRRGQAA
ncbi:MAG TPA: PIG-L family deacetylase [Streptosporangiaceae bacterium]|nr:PIG-L family deacetylase [Streptosporangiaceae bacterium]